MILLVEYMQAGGRFTLKFETHDHKTIQVDISWLRIMLIPVHIGAYWYLAVIDFKANSFWFLRYL